MAEMKSITVPLELPGDEAQAFGQLLRRIDYDTCAKLTDPRIAYENNRSECDVAWAARGIVLRHLTEAGVGPK